MGQRRPRRLTVYQHSAPVKTQGHAVLRHLALPRPLVELPHFHLHEVALTPAAVKELRGYQPNVVGALSYRGGGFRTAYLEAS